jgi:hypothetical protein
MVGLAAVLAVLFVDLSLLLTFERLQAEKKQDRDIKLTYRIVLFISTPYLVKLGSKLNSKVVIVKLKVTFSL